MARDRFSFAVGSKRHLGRTSNLVPLAFARRLRVFFIDFPFLRRAPNLLNL